MNKIISNDEMWKKQVSQDNIEKYTYAIKLMEKHTELERLKYKYETLKSSNKMLADDLKEVDLVIIVSVPLTSFKHFLPTITCLLLQATSVKKVNKIKGFFIIDPLFLILVL